MIVKDIKFVLDSFVDSKRTFKIRQSKNYSEIVTDTGKKIISNSNNKFQSGLFLFMMVKRDIEKFIKQYGQVEPAPELPVNYYNDVYDTEQKTIGIDINNAYWSVAFLKNYISKKTYLRGLEEEDFKPIRLSALSSLGKARVWKIYEGGKYVRNEMTEGEKALQDVYLDIRFTTYAVMEEIANSLGSDFHCWKTDCVFFTDNKINRKLVTNILDGYGLEYKLEKK
jgi:hypothetical protein